MRFALLHILFFWLTATPPQSLFAHGTEQYGAPDTEHCAPSTDDPCNDIHPGKECPPDEDGCGQCHCPGCGASAAAHAGFFRNEPVEMPLRTQPAAARASNFSYQPPCSSGHLTALFRPPIPILT